MIAAAFGTAAKEALRPLKMRAGPEALLRYANLLSAKRSPRSVGGDRDDCRLCAGLSSQDLDRAAGGGNLLCTPTSHLQQYLISADLSPKS